MCSNECTAYGLNLYKILAKLFSLPLHTMDACFPGVKANVEPGLFVYLFLMTSSSFQQKAECVVEETLTWNSGALVSGLSSATDSWATAWSQ